MSIVAAQLVEQISVQGADKATAELQGMGAATDEASGKLKAMALGGVAIAGAALIGAGVMAVKMAGDFQESMTQLVTGAGESKANLQMVSDGILQMAVKTGTSTQQLAAGMYMIESAGFHGAVGLQVLQASAMGAKVGAADLAVVANGVTTIMVDYASSNISAATATNILIATVAAGKTHMQDLAAAMASVLPTASAVGVKIVDVSAAMATMTAEGTPAADAATYLRQMLLALEVPGSKAVKTFQEIGISTSQVAAEMKVSLPGALQLIIDHLKTKFPEGSAAYVAALKDMAGGQKNFQAWLELTGTHLKVFGADALNIANAAKIGGNAITGWALVQEDFNFKIAQAGQIVNTLAIKIGTALIPILTNLMGWFGNVYNAIQMYVNSDAFQMVIADVQSLSNQIWNVLGPIVQQVGGWLMQAFSQIGPFLTTAVIPAFDAVVFAIEQFMENAQNAKNVLIPILAGIGAIIVAALIPVVISLAGAVWGLAAAVIAATWPLLAIGAAVAGLVAAFMHFYQTNSGFKSFIDGIVSKIKELWDKAQPVFNNLKTAIGEVVQAFQIVFLPAIQNVANAAKPLFDAFDHATGIFHNATNAAKPLFDAFDRANSVIRPVSDAAHSMADSFDRATGIIHSTTQAANPFVTVFQNVKKFIQDATPIFQGIWRTIQEIGGALKTTFVPVWEQLYAVWQSQIMPALQQLQAAIQPLLPVLKDLAKIVGIELLVALGLIVGAITGIIKGLAGFISGIATTIAGFIQLFTGVVQVISGVVTFIYDLLTGNFTKLGSDLGTIWTGIVNMFKGVWNIVNGLFDAGVGLVTGIVSGFVQGIIGFFQHLFDTLVGHSIIPDMINAIVGWFLSLPGRALSAVGGLLGQLAGFFGGLANQALTWGANILNNLASGIIGNIWSALGNAMNAVGNFISSHLPHSPAQLGPLRDLALQGSKIPEQIAQGMVSGIPHLQASLNLMLTPMTRFTPPASSISGGSTAQPINVSVYLDGAPVAKKLMPHIVQQIRTGVGSVGY